jgi:hypothetical protein
MTACSQSTRPCLRLVAGPCPQCGGKDRFSVHLGKQVFNCRGCGAKGRGAIDLVMFLDRCAFLAAVETIVGEPQGSVRPSARPVATQSTPMCSPPSASTACSRRRMSSTPAPKRESTSGSRLMSRNTITPARAAPTNRRCRHSMPALQTGHLVLYQTVSFAYRDRAATIRKV